MKTHADLLSSFDAKAEPLQDRRKVRAVAHDNILELDSAASRPYLGRSVVLDDGGCLAIELVGVMQQSFDAEGDPESQRGA